MFRNINFSSQIKKFSKAFCFTQSYGFNNSNTGYIPSFRSSQSSEDHHRQMAYQESRKIFNNLVGDRDKLYTHEIEQKLYIRGYDLQKNPRLKKSYARLLSICEESQTDYINEDQFHELMNMDMVFLKHILENRVTIKDWDSFEKRVKEIFEEVKPISDGNSASYIPELAKINPELFGISITTISGQQLNIGDTSNFFSIQSVSKPFTYGLALEEHGEEFVHKYIGREPSGVEFNKAQLNNINIPHNPMINSGAIISANLIKPNDDHSARVNFIQKSFQEMASVEIRPSIDLSTFLSEKATAYRNKQLTYLMLENKVFLKKVEHEVLRELELYFQVCSIQMNASQMSVVASTLANGGVNPINGKRIFDRKSVTNMLSLMGSCGMYDYSGEFNFKIGIPAKSGVSGIIIAVVPGKYGIATYSPKLDEYGNSVRGNEFLKRLVESYSLHSFKIDEKSKADDKKDEDSNDTLFAYMIYAASQGDINEMQSILARCGDLSLIDQGDYDERTPIHLAASEGHEDMVKYLLAMGANFNVIDRLGFSPLDEAIKYDHDFVIELLQEHGAKKGKEIDSDIMY